MIKFVARGDTTVADAYLSPILRRYIDRLARDIDQSRGTRLQLMQSKWWLNRLKPVSGQRRYFVGSLPAALSGR